MVRLNKFLAECGVGSRRSCDHHIAEGHVRVNGEIERRLGVRIEAGVDQVELDGRLLERPDEFTYILLNKPKGVVTTTSDERKRKTVLDLVPHRNRVFPVGRLDMNTSGLLLLSDDGELAYRLTHPSFEVDKVYEVQLDRELDNRDRMKLESGVELEEGRTARCSVVFARREGKRQIRITLHQGWNRQIRRMFASLGYCVVNLRRVALAFLTLNGLPSGSWRALTKGEVDRLRTLLMDKGGN